MSDLMLTHYTGNIDAIASILEFGFFYSYRPTRTFEQLFQDAKIDAQEPDDHAMICFTELDVDTTCEHRSKFGEYGIAISLEWAIKMGAKKVEYVKRGSGRYNEYLKKLKSSAPTSPFGYSTNEQQMPRLEKSLRQIWLGDVSAAHYLGAGSDYLELLIDLLWVQTERHKDQIEWRIRNPNSVGGMQFRKPTEADKKLGRVNMNFCNIFNINNKEDSIKCAIAVMSKNEDLRQASFLSIPPEEVKFVIAPKEDQALLREILNKTQYENVAVVS